MSDLRSIDVPAVAELATVLGSAAAEIERRGAAAVAALRSVGRSTGVGDLLVRLGADAADSGRAVRRRVEEIRDLEWMLRRMGEQGLALPLPDTRFATPEEARAAGAALAASVLRHQGYGDDDMYAALRRLERDAGDPEFVRGFFTHLGWERTVELTWLVQEDTHFGVIDWDHLAGWESLIRAKATAIDAGVVPMDDIRRFAHIEELTDLLRFGSFRHETTVELADRALTTYAGLLKTGLLRVEPGLLYRLAGDPRLAGDVYAELDDDVLRELLGDAYDYHEGVDLFVDAALTRVALVDPVLAEENFLKTVRVVALEAGVGRPELKPVLAEATAVHLEAFADWATSPGGPEDSDVKLSHDQLAEYLRRVVADSDEAFDVLHGGAAVFVAEQLGREGALEVHSVELAGVGAVYGLLAVAHEKLELASAESEATLWTLGSTALTLVPTPGGLAAKLSVSAVKAAAGAFARSRASGARDDAALRADVASRDLRSQGMLLLAAARYEADRRAGVASAVTPPDLLLRADGSMLPFDQIDGDAELEAFREWYDSEAVREAINAVDDEFVENFDNARGSG